MPSLEIANLPDSIGCLDIPTGNLVADAMRFQTNADLAVIETDVLVYPLYKGKITSDDIFQVMPYGFDNQNAYNSRIYKITIKGSDIYNVIGFAQLIRGSVPIVQVSGFTYQFTPNVPMEVSDISIDISQIYKVAGSIFTLYVSSLLTPNIISVETTNLNVFHALKNYILNSDNLNYHSECRIKYKTINYNEKYKEFLKFEIRNNMIIWKDKKIASIYNISGRKIYNLKENEIYKLKSGVYIIKSGKQTYKILIP